METVSPSFKRIIDALDMALIGLDEVSDEYRKRIFVGLVSIQDLTELYSFLRSQKWSLPDSAASSCSQSVS